MPVKCWKNLDTIPNKNELNIYKEFSMNLIMTLLVRDEEDILEANIEYHLAQGVDFILVTDNNSVDRTGAILEDYQNRGLLYSIYEQGDNYEQASWVTRMARLAFTNYDADWVINNDADEFWWPENGNLKDLLSSLDNKFNVARAKRSNFLPPSVLDQRFFSDSMTIRTVDSINFLGNPLPSKVCHRAYPNIVVAKGAHSVSLIGKNIKEKSISATIFHFPLRSYKQFRKKVLNFGAIHKRNVELNNKTNIKYQKWCELLEAGALESYYMNQILDEKEIENGIEEGRFVKDLRLKIYLNNLLRQ